MKKVMIGILMLVSLIYAEPVVIDRVVDGDTVKVIDTNDKVLTVRLAYIDALESTYNSRAKKLGLECRLDKKLITDFGIEAKVMLNSLLPKGTLLNLKITGKPDRNGRVIGVLYNGEDAYYTSYNYLLVRLGYAIPFTTFIKDKVILEQYNKTFEENGKYNLERYFTDKEIECIKSFED